MKIKSGFVLEKVGESYLACATGKLATQFSGFVRLNGTGAFLWNILNGGADMQQLVEAMVKEYDVSPEIAQRDAAAFVENLRKNGILDE
jgi:hypothetical protein